ncbi:Alpha/Beta hydrolase protein [Aspergillus pseudodeflectus]|uniref:Alpha/Beta hydrolase protein n=1 Tax=Aspergillus pseudodeflectus TaxID=176178 RepID=A0ABR4K9U3_9EURO
MAASTSGSFFLSDGLEVYSRVWEPTDSPIKSHIAFLHGFGDRCDQYDAFFSLLVANYPVKVHAWDRRGWGKTVRTKAQMGDTGKTPQVIAEIHEALIYIASTIPDIRQTPLFLMGHSMGGQESALYLLNPELDGHRPPITGWILEAPYIGLDPASHPNRIVVAVAKGVARVFPKLKFTQPLSGDFITRDREVRERYRSDPLCHNTGTLEGLQDLLQRESDLTTLSLSDQPVPSGLSARLPCPVFWAHGSGDMITSYAISKRLYHRLEPHNEADLDAKTWKSFEGAFHQLHSEPDGVAEEYMRDVGNWVAKITASTPFNNESRYRTSHASVS